MVLCLIIHVFTIIMDLMKRLHWNHLRLAGFHRNSVLLLSSAASYLRRVFLTMITLIRALSLNDFRLALTAEHSYSSASI